MPHVYLALISLLTVPAGAGSVDAPPPSVAEWQQGVHYTIEATLDEDRELLRGAATLVYRNASPETLDRLYLHLHLNAFRPNSIWARAERRPDLDFQALVEPDFAFERLRSVTLDGTGLIAAYPHAPDSTVVELTLPEPLASGEELTLRLEWEARPSTLCRRQCRAGRDYDFAQWYPRIAPFDRGGWQPHPLYPQGEFYGEFATYDVTLDLAEDQVIGATGVPVEGDPGWRPAAGSPEVDVEPQSDWYEEPRPARSPGLLEASTADGRKRVRFYAEDVHHFAWSTSPDYRYERGQLAPTSERDRPVTIRVLYRPGDEESWGDGQAVERTAGALAFLEGVFGPYPWPQLTNLHRLEGGGTEFPMVLMDGSASPGLIMHETAHQYVHGILANNEWKEAWLDEGFASFLTSWAVEERAPGLWRQTRERNARNESRGHTHPIATSSEDFPDFDTYGYMAYSRPAFMYHMLRCLVGEETFRAILKEYYARHALGHVTEDDFRSVVRDVSDRDLSWFFEQWLHTTGTLDYGLGEVSVEETAGGWKIRAEVLREGDAWMPVFVAAMRPGADEGSPTARDIARAELLRSRDRRQLAEFTVSERPGAIVLDPMGCILDADPSNDRWSPLPTE